MASEQQDAGRGSKEAIQDMNEALAPQPEKSAIQVTSGPTVAVAASFTAFPILEPLRFWLHEVLDLDARIELADAGQVMQTLLDPKSIFAMNPSGLNVVLLRWEDLGGSPSHESEEAVELLTSVLSSSASGSRTPHLVCLCPPSPQILARPEKTAKLQEMDDRLKSPFRLVSIPPITASTLFLPVSDIAKLLVMVLMFSAFRNRNALQSSSIATILTGSKPCFPNSFQPLSRLNSHLYFFF
jgi:hypothetical protein